MYTEKMLWDVTGELLDGSDWIAALTNSVISTSGKAESFIRKHHICRSRYIKQVSVATFNMLMKKAFCHYVEKCQTMMTVHLLL